jgi:tRNA(Arg) A34 adenosine deaminase TadA
MTAATAADERGMRAALAEADRAPEHPFGAVLVDRRSGEVVARGHNRAATDATRHGEMEVLRAAAESGVTDFAALDLYTTAEPCPMCQAAIAWCGVTRVVHGIGIDDLVELGWKQIRIPAAEVAERTPFLGIDVVADVLAAECRARFEAAARR